MTLGVSGCASGGQPHSSSSGTSSASGQPAAGPAKSAGGYDISRIAQLANQFPAGFSVTPIPRTTLTQEQADNFGDMVTKLGIVIDPPQCEALMKSVRLIGGSQLQGLRGSGPQEITVIAMQFPQPTPLPGGGDNCGHITVTAPGVDGTADRLPAPAISGATTTGVKEHLNITTAGVSQTMDQYMYIAMLGDKTGVSVTSQSDKGPSDTQPLEKLLVKGVAAVRG